MTTFDSVPARRCGARRRWRRPGPGAIQADASRSSSSCMAVRAPATTCSRAQLTTIIDQEKLSPVRFQVVQQAGRRQRHRGGLCGQQEGRPARDRLLHQSLAGRSAGAEAAANRLHDMTPDHPAGGRAGAGRGAGGFAVQDAWRTSSRRRRRKPGKLQLVRRLDHLAREHRAPAADEGHRRAAGRSSRSRPAANGLPRCSAAMST